MSIEEARRRVAERLVRRSERLGSLLRTVRDPSMGSPYARLLAGAGIEPAEADRLVADSGVEQTLDTLLRHGVYLTGDEFKGRTPVVRGSLSFTVDPARLLNPLAVVHGLSETSGSRGARTPVPIDLAFIEDHAVNTHLTLDAHGGRGWRHAHWGVPGGTAVTNPLELAKGGTPPDRWFTPVDPSLPGLHARYRWGSRAMWLGSRLAGVPMPGPTLAPLGDPEPIVRWMAEVLGRGEIPHLWTFASSAVLVCEAAAHLGVDIAGARFTAGGEPTTLARRAVVEGAGAVVIPRMGATETDILSYACVHPRAPDDMHFFHDRHALIQPGDGSGTPLPPTAMVLTSLLESAPILLLNVCMGDQATVSDRPCDCGLGRLGWTTHIAGVRSYEKLTAGGITLLDIDVIRVLEEVLPARFGGSPTDYQLVERLDEGGARPVVQLLVDPDLGSLDESHVRDVFLDAVGGGTGGERLMELQWRGGDVLRIVREAPRHTPSGKILHLHVETD